MKMVKRISLLICLLIGFQSYAQTPNTRILFIFDASGSMWTTWEKEFKIDVAKKLLTNLIDSLGDNPDIEFALRVFGHRSPSNRQDCKDSHLEVPFSKGNKKQIIETIKEIRPKGTTPIAYSLSLAANDFPPQRNVRNIIILITDGIEECSGDPCAVSLALQKRGIFLRPFIIGLGIPDDLFSKLECAGHFFNATDQASFQRVLNIVITNALNNTTAQVNLLDSYGKAMETDVNLSFYDSKLGHLKYNFYHTFNDAGLPDTLFLDPMTTYDLTVHTLPAVELKNIKMNMGRHNIIAVSSPQGFLQLQLKGITTYKSLQAIIKKAGTNEIVYVQDVSSTQKYLTGNYDIDILTLPRISLKNVEIKQSHTTTIDIQQPGKIVVYSREHLVGSIYQVIGGKLVWVTNIDDNLLNQVIVMQPGNYVFSYRRKRARSTSYTNEREFTVASGSSLSINIR